MGDSAGPGCWMIARIWREPVVYESFRSMHCSICHSANVLRVQIAVRLAGELRGPGLRLFNLSLSWSTKLW